VKHWKVFFSSERSIGLEVEAPNERQAKVKAMTVLKENRGDRNWSPEMCVDWENGASQQSPPRSPFHGEFPPIVKVKEM
jgi:hypothetical protein